VGNVTGDSTISNILSENRHPSGDEPLTLLVFDGAVRSIESRAGQALVFGRATTADVPVNDLRVSRMHARIQFGERVTVADLGSANGTRVGGAFVGKVPVDLALGDVVQIGNTTIVLCPRQTAASLQVYGHGFFVSGLEERCAARASSLDPFAVLRVRVANDGDVRVLEEVVESVLAGQGIVASYAPRELELIVEGRSPAAADDMAGVVVRALEAVRVEAHAGVAVFPRDGRTADKLIARAAPLVNTGAGPQAQMPPLGRGEPTWHGRCHRGLA
jgi:hypothetical protein